MQFFVARLRDDGGRTHWYVVQADPYARWLCPFPMSTWGPYSTQRQALTEMTALQRHFDGRIAMPAPN